MATTTTFKTTRQTSLLLSDKKEHRELARADQGPAGQPNITLQIVAGRMVSRISSHRRTADRALLRCTRLDRVTCASAPLPRRIPICPKVINAPIRTCHRCPCHSQQEIISHHMPRIIPRATSRETAPDPVVPRSVNLNHDSTGRGPRRVPVP